MSSEKLKLSPEEKEIFKKGYYLGQKALLEGLQKMMDKDLDEMNERMEYLIEEREFYSDERIELQFKIAAISKYYNLITTLLKDNENNLQSK